MTPDLLFWNSSNLHKVKRINSRESHTSYSSPRFTEVDILTYFAFSYFLSSSSFLFPSLEKNISKFKKTDLQVNILDDILYIISGVLIF